MWSFRTLVNATVPGAFNKLTPPDTTTNVPVNNLSLSWSASSLATSYQYCYDTVNNNSCDTSWMSATALSAILNGLSYNTIYYWQVCAVNASGVTEADGGTWYDFKTLLAPPGSFGKSAPANFSSEKPTSLSLNWGTSSGTGITYEYCIGTTTCTSASTWLPAGTNITVNVSGLQYSTTYYWQVRAVNTTATVYADNGTNWIFSTNIAPPSNFGKTSPGNNAQDQPLNLTLTWGTSTGPMFNMNIVWIQLPVVLQAPGTWQVPTPQSTSLG
jgi:hypothetical protein